jgi:hypothetical protein
MAIEFACRCGSRFRVDDEMAGKRAKCKACQQYVIIPPASTVAPVGQPAAVGSQTPPPFPPPPPPPPVVLPAAPPDSDPWMDRQIEQHQRLTQSAASNPGRLRINVLKHWMSFPLWPTLWLGLVLLSIVGVLLHWVFFVVAVPFAVLLGLYWWIQRAKFISGCTNPAVVVSVSPPLVAVLTDLSLGQTGTRWFYIKVLEQPLDSMTGEGPNMGQRLATVATYRQGENSEHWSDFWPVAVNCVTWNVDDIAQVFSTLSSADWQQLDTALRQIPRPYSPGLYKVELELPTRRAPLPGPDLARRMAECLTHGDENRCWLSPPGIPPYLLQSAITYMAKGNATGEPLALILATGDKMASTGLLLTSTGVYFHFAAGSHGMFRWTELAGAGCAADGLEVVLTGGARFRWGRELGKFSNPVEALLDGIAKAP